MKRPGWVMVAVLSTLTVLAGCTSGGTIGSETRVPPPLRGRIYVGLAETDRVAVDDVSELAVAGVIPLPGGPDHLAVSPAGDRLYVALLTGAVAEIDTESRRIIRTFAIDGPGHGIGVSDDGRWVYAAVPDAGTVAMVDARTGNVRSLPLPGGPNHIERTPDGAYMLVTQTEARAITALDARSGEVVATIDVGYPPHQFAFVPGAVAGAAASAAWPGDADTLRQAQPDLGDSGDPSSWLLSDTGEDGAGWSTAPAEVRLVVQAEPFLAAGLRPDQLAPGWRYQESSSGLHGHHPTPGRLVRAEAMGQAVAAGR